MLKKIPIIIILNLILAYQYADAYNGKVHSKINENAVDYSSLNHILINQLDIQNGVEKVFARNGKNQNIKEWIVYGGEGEDFGGYDSEDDILGSRCFNHFHDPLKRWDYAGLDSSLNFFYWLRYSRAPVSPILWGLDPGRQNFTENITGDWSWGKARGLYYNYLTGKDLYGNVVASTRIQREAKFADCFRSAGQVMHLLQDTSVPLHTRNDVHVLPIFVNGVTTFGTYETYTGENIGFLDYIPDQMSDYPESISLTDPNPDSAYGNIAPVSGLFDRNQYNEGDAIPLSSAAIGLAEYSNANFLTEDTMWKYPHPSLSDTNYDPSIWLNPEEVDAEDGERDQRIYFRKVAGEPINHLMAASYWYYQLFMWNRPEVQYAFILDEKCFADYAAKLVPRAVGYSAAMLDYFFRGDIDMVPNEEGGSGYVIVNKSAEDMEGLFELYYDDQADQRIKLWEENFVLGAAGSGADKSSNIYFNEPSDAKNSGKYILVFRGRLGRETDAVVGKIVESEEFYIRINGIAPTYSKIIKIVDALGNSQQLTSEAPFDKFVVPPGMVKPLKIYLYYQDGRSHVEYWYSKLNTLFDYFAPCSYDDPEVYGRAVVEEVQCTGYGAWDEIKYLKSEMVPGGLEGAVNYKKIVWSKGIVSYDPNSDRMIVNFTAKVMRRYWAVEKIWYGGNCHSCEPVIREGTYPIRYTNVAYGHLPPGYTSYLYPDENICKVQSEQSFCDPPPLCGVPSGYDFNFLWASGKDRISQYDGLTSENICIVTDDDGLNPSFSPVDVISEYRVSGNEVQGGYWCEEESPPGFYCTIGAGTVIPNWNLWEFRMVDTPSDWI